MALLTWLESRCVIQLYRARRQQYYFAAGAAISGLLYTYVTSVVGASQGMMYDGCVGCSNAASVGIWQAIVRIS
jgi:hypothetical protein